MDLTELMSRLSRLTAADMQGLAQELARHDSSADEVDAWHAVVAIDAALRRHHGMRRAAHAAYAATQAVRAAAHGCETPLPDADVIRVARAAAVIARAIVAGPDADAELRLLLARWSPLSALA